MRPNLPLTHESFLREIFYFRIFAKVLSLRYTVFFFLCPPYSRQLCLCLEQILKHDFPAKWNGVLTQTHSHLSSEDQATWLGSLMALYQLSKKYKSVLFGGVCGSSPTGGSYICCTYNHAVLLCLVCLFDLAYFFLPLYYNDVDILTYMYIYTCTYTYTCTC